MNLSKRTKLSLCQFLTLFSRGQLILLLSKYGFATDELENQWAGQRLTEAIREAVLRASPPQLGELIQELARTHDSVRTGVSPRYRFDERWEDLRLCLELDGYAEERNEYGLELKHFVPIEPIIAGVEAAEDDLTRELRLSGLPETNEIVRILDNSAETFRRGDLNGCLANARVALQTLATSIAQTRQADHPDNFDAEKWGQVIAYLRKAGFITAQEEKGLTGVFSLISAGSHTPIGFTDEEFARLGRSLAVSLCYFLAKRFNARER